MTDPWCWYINADIKGVFVDGIHVTIYSSTMDPVGIFINIHLIGGIPTLLKMAINFVSFPIKNGDFQCEFHPGWWLTYPSEKYTFVRLDHHPNYWGK